MSQRRYYHAYDDRYRQVHSLNLTWFDESPSPIVLDTIHAFGIQKQNRVLEIGCGEGRDAFPLLKEGYDLIATDISPTAVNFCQNKMPDYKKHFSVLDCVSDSLNEKFDFIYAVAVIHMLVLETDRNAFYNFIYEHLSDRGVALICTMGDGTEQRKSDISTAFDIRERIHESSGTPVRIASTSCRVVDFQTFDSEIQCNHLEIIEQGLTAIEPDFPVMMFAVVRKVQAM